MHLHARVFSVAAAVVLVGLAFAPRSRAHEEPSCSWRVEYDLGANLKLTDTLFGQGDGVFPVGPGKLVLRFQDAGGRPGGDVAMTHYQMRQHVRVEAKSLAWTTTVTTDTTAVATPNACAVVAEGRLDPSGAIRWTTAVDGYRTDGTVTCHGSLCGKFGAPAAGQSPLHVAPASVRFKPFVFAPDMKTFAMASTVVEKLDSPKHSAEIAIAGRETRRVCVPVAPCK